MQNEGNKEKHKNRKLKQKLIPVLLALVCILALVLVKKLYLDKSTGRYSNQDLTGPYKVIRIVDGDTIVVRIDGDDKKVRLIGVDTPESVAPETSGKTNSEEGKEASEYVSKLLKDRSVYLEFDVSRSDQYGRVLAYVYLEDGRTMLQEQLLSEGIAAVMTYQPNVKYADEFLKLQKRARESGKGFWGSGYYK